jgi:NADPH-dependent glutamate synthase beta subunit-like oxidoreductase/Pyruvate/2-oxoacid:ferredoxin oxidoreductase delta subunit
VDSVVATGVSSAMAKIVSKKRKLGSRGSGASGREQSPLRPYYQEKLAPCGHEGCPNHNPIRAVMRIINNYDFKNRSEDETWEDCFRVFSQTTCLPATMGRVCPALCEDKCNRTSVDDKPVHIRCVERFIGDYALQKGLKYDTSGMEKQPEKVAVIGAGPAGLNCAYHLACKGYGVTVFEAFTKPGGMLRYGIPNYRLPPDIIDGEAQRLADMGIEFRYSTIVGKDIPYDELKQQYDAIFVGIGAHKGYTLGVEGEDAENVMTGTGFLNEVNSGSPPEVGSDVIVIGGGDTAIDAARISRRLGAKVKIVYRRTIKEMPAIAPEIEEAQKEGVEIDFLAAPIKILRNNGRATGMTCIKMELGEPDASGRRRPVPIEGSEFDIPASFIIPAISQEPDFEPLEHLHEGRDWIKTDTDGMVTTAADKTWAGGDAVNLGLATIAQAQGRQAAEAIHRAFRGLPAPQPPDLPEVGPDKPNKNFWLEKQQQAVDEAHIAVEEALASLDRETTRTFNAEEARQEAARCMSCGLCFDCENCFKFCTDNAVLRPPEKGGKYEFKLQFCTGCKKCMEECPCGYIDMK